jgi:hypothetical protein
MQELTLCATSFGIAVILLLNPLISFADGIQDEGQRKLEIPSPWPTVPALIVPMESDLETSVQEGPDFLVFYIKKTHLGKVKATLSVYVGQFPERLFGLTKTNLFDQEIGNFIYERTAWFTWMPVEHGDKHLASAAYLYNVFRHVPNEGTPYIVNVIVAGPDFAAVNKLKRMAEQMTFKGLNTDRR